MVPTTVREWHSEVVGRVDESITGFGVGIVGLVDRVDSSRYVTTSQWRDVSERLRRQGYHAREERAPVGVTVLVLDRTRTHLQRQVDHAQRCMDGAIAGLVGVELRGPDEQNAGPRCTVDWTGDRNFITLGDLIEGGVLDVARASRTPNAHCADSDQCRNEYG